VDAYWVKEKFFQIYDCETKADARKAYERWTNDLPLFIHKAFKPLMNTASNWETEIFNYFDRRISNNYTECMNGISKMANRKGRGYSFKVIRFKLLFGYNATRVHVSTTVTPAAFSLLQRSSGSRFQPWERSCVLSLISHVSSRNFQIPKISNTSNAVLYTGDCRLVAMLQRWHRRRSCSDPGRGGPNWRRTVLCEPIGIVFFKPIEASGSMRPQLAPRFRRVRRHHREPLVSSRVSISQNTLAVDHHTGRSCLSRYATGALPWKRQVEPGGLSF